MAALLSFAAEVSGSPLWRSRHCGTACPVNRGRWVEGKINDYNQHQILPLHLYKFNTKDD